MNSAVLTVVVVAAAVTDVRKRRIYNLLTLPAVVAGPAIAFAHGGGAEFISSLEGAAAMFAIGVSIMALKIAGGGDAKLLVAAGSLGGLHLVVPSLLYTALAGGVLSVATLLRRRKLTVGKNRSECIPYGVAIAAGTLVALAGSWVK